MESREFGLEMRQGGEARVPKSWKMAIIMRLAEGLEDHGGKDDDVIGAFGLGEIEGTEKRVRREEDVGVGKEQPGRRGLPGGESHGVGLAHPPGRKIGDVDDGEPGLGFRCNSIHDGAGCIGGAVINGEDFYRNRLDGEERAEGGLDIGFFIAGGDDDGDKRQLRWFERVGVAGIEEIWDARQIAQGGEDARGPQKHNEPVEREEEVSH